MKILSLSKLLLYLYLFFPKLIISDNNKFGKHLLDLFYLDKNYTNVNHGSYGSPPKSVITKYRSYQEQMDFNPEKWIRYFLNDKLNEVREIVANYINANISNVVIVENASDGINSVFKSMLNKGDKILMFDIAYSTVKTTAEFLVDSREIEIIEVQLDEELLNGEDDLILNRIENIIKSDNNKDRIKLANIDHIASVPAVIIPIKKIIRLLRKYNIPSFIDGAHTVGQIKLDMEDLDPDFYISNFHKWGYNPKSACVLYVKSEFQNKIHPNIISSYYGKGFIQEFSYTGIKDYSSYLTIKDSLEFRHQFGENEIMNYLKNLSVKAGQEIVQIWNTELLIKNKDRLCSMVNIRIPCDDEEIIKKVVKKCLFDHNTFIAAFKFSNGKFYARFSAQIYNEISDYIYSANVFLNELEKEMNLIRLNPNF